MQETGHLHNNKGLAKSDHASYLASDIASDIGYGVLHAARITTVFGVPRPLGGGGITRPCLPLALTLRGSFVGQQIVNGVVMLVYLRVDAEDCVASGWAWAISNGRWGSAGANGRSSEGGGTRWLGCPLGFWCC